MCSSGLSLAEQAQAIWRSAVAAVDPRACVREALLQPTPELARALQSGRILVVGAGKAGAAMAAGVEEALADRLDRITGVINVPEGSEEQGKAPACRAIRLHPARPAGSNQPTEQGVAGAQAILQLADQVGPEDVILCLLSGGGSALLPAPVEGITLKDKQEITALLHACGATIEEMNCVRKHLSRVKGGRLAEAFLGENRSVFGLILSDVVGDPLDVIASGPTAADPTTYADALAILERYHLRERIPAAAWHSLQRGQRGEISETPKVLPEQVRNLVLGNNRRALDVARQQAEQAGFAVVDLGSYVQGETQPVALALAGVVRSIQRDGQPVPPPAVLLCGGETTVTLPEGHGKGGRNQEFVLAALYDLGREEMRGVAILSGGTDGEDGPTDAAGAWADEDTLPRAQQLGLDPAAYLARHDSYPFFQASGNLLVTGLTGTNVMDVRLFLVGGNQP
jgi:glycerate 2-kinase